MDDYRETYKDIIKKVSIETNINEFEITQCLTALNEVLLEEHPEYSEDRRYAISNNLLWKMHKKAKKDTEYNKLQEALEAQRKQFQVTLNQGYEKALESLKKEAKCTCEGKIHPWCLPGFDKPNMNNRISMGDIC